MEKTTSKIPLIQKASGSFIRVSLVLMLLSTVALYFYVHWLLRSEVEEELFSTQARVESALEKGHPVIALPPVVEVAKVASLKNQVIKDTVIYDPSQDEMEEFKELTSYKIINGIYYKISVRNLVVESGNVLSGIVLSYLGIIILMFLFLVYFNKKFNARLWQPFFKNLNEMKRFSVVSEKDVLLVDSSILEFSELNNEIRMLTTKVRNDYQNLKQFTEDVSHELQTPLAIIQAKIENLLNEAHLHNLQFEQLTSIQKDIHRLTQLNKRLTLLTKIENNQFLNVQKINLKEILQQLLEDFSEITPLELNYTVQDNVLVNMDTHLATILCTNLVSNAIKYTSENGTIIVETHTNKLIIKNTGVASLKNPDQLFTRFYKESSNQKSTGLGLAIVHRICTLYKYTIAYHFSNNYHVFTVDFTR